MGVPHPPPSLLLEVMDRPIRLRRSPTTGNSAVLRKEEGPYEAYVKDARVIVPSLEHCSLTIHELRMAWDDLTIEIQLRSASGWNQVEEWDELSLVLEH
ncbi:MAG TPA: hypothetical protein VFY28_01475 [Candidatus Paceibacterota bacterium]|nr:hypothetical protein [Candidatus Paceibacterota bacterium]